MANDKWHSISGRIPLGLIFKIVAQPPDIHPHTKEWEYTTDGGNTVKAVYTPNPTGAGWLEFFDPED